jgi:hypothetical protein
VDEAQGAHEAAREERRGLVGEAPRRIGEAAIKGARASRSASMSMAKTASQTPNKAPERALVPGEREHELRRARGQGAAQDVTQARAVVLA